MFREMRRKTKQIEKNSIIELLEKMHYGVLSVVGDDGYPYGVPVNYYYSDKDNKIYFHGSKYGHKADSLRKNDKVSFTICGDEQIKNEKWAPFVQSVIVFGKCHMITDKEKTMQILKTFASKYYPSEDLIDEEIAKDGKAVTIFEISIEHISGKEIQEK